jgi:hypothetical protein
MAGWCLPPQEPGRAHALRQHDPDTGEDKLLATTSQYVASLPIAMRVSS